MSATSLPAAGARVRSRSAVAGHVLVVAAGTSLLLIRTQVAAMPDARRVGILALVYGAMLAAALAVPVEPDRARARRAAVLVAGLAAVGLAAVVSGRPPAAPAAHGPASRIVVWTWRFARRTGC